MPQPPIIRVPRTARSSYQPHRPLARNVLLASQVKQFKEIEKDFAPEDQTGMPLELIQTEGQAAEYIRRMTKKLHHVPERK